MSNYGAPNIYESNRYRTAHRATKRALSKCAHLAKKLLADGNTFRCEDCQKIVGFLINPRARIRSKLDE